MLPPAPFRSAADTHLAMVAPRHVAAIAAIAVIAVAAMISPVMVAAVAAPIGSAVMIAAPVVTTRTPIGIAPRTTVRSAIIPVPIGTGTVPIGTGTVRTGAVRTARTLRVGGGGHAQAGDDEAGGGEHA